MKHLNYSKFIEVYDQLSEEYKFIVFQLLQDMEHNKDHPDDKIDYKRGLSIAMAEQEFTINSLTTALEEKTGCVDLRETVASMIKRGSKTSSLFKNTLDILDIDELYLIKNSEYFQTRISNIEWCFNSISEQNKEAVYFLSVQLTNLKSITEFIKHFPEIHSNNNYL
ncbi:TPA: hypothetical protein LA827_002779 [Clostridium botulinum]|nr:hypothetical protein [Clostridium botulinum]